MLTWISRVMALVFLFSVLTPDLLYAQRALNPAPRSAPAGSPYSWPTYQPGNNPNTPPNNRHAQLQQDVSSRVQNPSGNGDPETEAQNGMIDTAMEILGRPGHMNYVLQDLEKSVQTAGGDILKAQICDGEGDEEICVPALAYAQAALHNEVVRDDIHRSVDFVSGRNGRRTSYSSATRPSCGGSTAALIANYGMPFRKYAHFEEDYKALYECAYESVDKWLPNDCDKGHSEFLNKIKSQGAIERNSWNDSTYASLCEDEISSMSALVVLAKMGSADKQKQAADAIHKRVKKGTGGAPVVIHGIEALAVLGTRDALDYIVKFLTEESLPSYAGDAFDAGLGHPAKSLVSAGICVAQAVGQENYCPEFSNRLNETFLYPADGRASGGKDVLNRPLRSVYEDIGEMLVELSATYPALKDVNSRIMAKAQSGRRQYADKTHLPLIVGMMQGFVKNSGRVSNHTIIPQNMVQYLFETDWYDLNEPTQRRIHQQARQFAKTFHRGLQLPAGFDPSFPVDTAKQARFKKYQNAFQGAHYVDTIYNVAMLVGLGIGVAALGKNLVTRVINYVNTGKRTLTWAKVKDLWKLRRQARQPAGQQSRNAAQGGNVAQQGGGAVAGQPRPTANSRPQTPPQPRNTAPAPNGQAPRLNGNGAPRPQTGNVPVRPEPIQNLPPARGAGQGVELTGGRVTPAPIVQEQTITGALDAHVSSAGGNVPSLATEPASVGKSFWQRAGDWWTDYRTALRNSNSLQSGIPFVPAPGEMGAARAARLMQEATRAEELIGSAARYGTQLGEASSTLSLSSAQALENIRSIESVVGNFEGTIGSIHYVGPAQEELFGIYRALARSDELANLQAQASRVRRLLNDIDLASNSFLREEAAIVNKAQVASAPMRAAEVTNIGQYAGQHFGQLELQLDELGHAIQDWEQAHKAAMARLRRANDAVFDFTNLNTIPEPFEQAWRQLGKTVEDGGYSINLQLFYAKDALQDGRNTMSVLQNWKDLF